MCVDGMGRSDILKRSRGVEEQMIRVGRFISLSEQCG